MAAIRTLQFRFTNFKYLRELNRWKRKALKRGVKPFEIIQRLVVGRPRKGVKRTPPPKQPIKHFYQIVATSEEEVIRGREGTGPYFTQKGELFIFEPKENLNWLFTRIDLMDFDPDIKRQIWNGYLGLRDALTIMGWQLPFIEGLEAVPKKRKRKAVRGFRGLIRETMQEVGDANVLPFEQFIRLNWIPFFLMGGSVPGQKSPGLQILPREAYSKSYQRAQDGLFPTKIKVKGIVGRKGRTKTTAKGKVMAIARIYGVFVDKDATISNWYRAPAVAPAPKLELHELTPINVDNLYEELYNEVDQALDRQMEEGAEMIINQETLPNLVRSWLELAGVTEYYDTFLQRLYNELEIPR